MFDQAVAAPERAAARPSGRAGRRRPGAPLRSEAGCGAIGAEDSSLWLVAGGSNHRAPGPVRKPIRASPG